MSSNHLAENSGSFIQKDNVQLIKQQKLTKLKKLPLIAALKPPHSPSQFLLKRNNNQAVRQNRPNVMWIKELPGFCASHCRAVGTCCPCLRTLKSHGTVICLLFIYSFLPSAIIIHFLLLKGTSLALLDTRTLYVSTAEDQPMRQLPSPMLPLYYLYCRRSKRSGPITLMLFRFKWTSLIL